MLDEAFEYLEKRKVTKNKSNVNFYFSNFFLIIKKNDSEFSYEIIVVDDGSRDNTSKVNHLKFFKK